LGSTDDHAEDHPRFPDSFGEVKEAGRMRKIPQFKSEDEEREFWDSHSFLDFPEEVEEVEPFSPTPKLKEEILSGKRRRKMKKISLRFDPYLIEMIKKIAKRKSIPYQSLIRMWLAERLEEELSKSRS
jgi:predicted DNA binding CopG/RHH family protein